MNEKSEKQTARELALFATVVSQPNFWMNYGGKPQVAPFTELLLDHRWKGGANPNARASLRKQLHPGYGPEHGDHTMHEYRDVTCCPGASGFIARSS